MLCQAHGEKRVTMWSPDRALQLSRGDAHTRAQEPCQHVLDRLSDVTPDFRDDLRPGEVLFIPSMWFHDVLSRFPAHSITRLSELLPHNWKPTTSPAHA